MVGELRPQVPANFTIVELFHHITVLCVSEEEAIALSEAGVEFREVVRGTRGEQSVIFEMGDGDPRWNKVSTLLKSLKGNDRVPKEHRVRNLSMTAPTMEAVLQKATERVAAFKLFKESLGAPKWLNEYSGQSVEDLLSLEGNYRTDSLVLAFEQAISEKAQREGAESLTDEERIVLAVEALEREVNNGGYDQFFVNSSRGFVPIIVNALQRIGCKETASITRRAIEALGITDLRSDAVEAAICTRDEKRRAAINRCDDSYYKSTEPIAGPLFAFIKANQGRISF